MSAKRRGSAGCCSQNVENAAHIATELERRRLEVGISVAELARRIGGDRKRLWYVLNGQREMRVDEFLKLCVALRVDPRSLECQHFFGQILKR